MDRLPTPKGDHRKLHRSWGQLRGAIVRANKEVLVASRGWGKTRAVFAERLSHNAFAMQGSLGGLVIPSYSKFLTQFIVNLKKGLADLGYLHERDYLIGDHFKKWRRPYTDPHEWDHAIHWRNGSGTALIAQSGEGAGNAFDMDYYVVDEGKFIDGPRFEYESIPALRGNEEYFKGMSEHFGIFICSDRPLTKKEKWFYRYRDLYTKEMQEGVQLILQVYIENQKLLDAIANRPLTPNTIAKYQSTIRANEAAMNAARKDLVYYHEATVADNIDVIGLDKLIALASSMSDIKFDTAFLNKEVDTVEGGFYPDFDYDRHTYDPGVTSWTLAKGYDDERLSQRDCRHDAKLIADLQLEMAMDYGGKFNCAAIGQMVGPELKVDNGIGLSHPAMTTDVAHAVVKYYKPHRTKRVRFHHDHTSKQGKVGLSKNNYRDAVVEVFREAGWEVLLNYIGHTPDYVDRYDDWSKRLRARRPVPVTFNRVNCEDLITSMRLAQIRDGKNGLEKDKRSEDGPIEDQAQATHYSDAVDTLVDGCLKQRYREVDLPTPSLFV